MDVELGAVGERLRIGMTAKMEFVLRSAMDTLAVPKSCLTDDGMGGKYVTRVLGDGTDPSQTETVPVTVGAEGDYYAAVTGDGLSEGDMLIDTGTAAPGDGSDAGSVLDGMYN